MRIRNSRILFPPPPDLVSSSTVHPPLSSLNFSSTSLFSDRSQEQNSRTAVGDGEKSNESCSSSSGSSPETSSVSWESEEKEKSRCSRKNGMGWRCRKQKEEGHSLCYHHVHQSRHWKRLSISSNCRVGKKKQRMMMISTLLNRPLPLLPNPTL